MILAFDPSCPLFSSGREVQLNQVLLSVARQQHQIAYPAPDELARLIPGTLWLLYGEMVRQSYKNATKANRQWVRPTNCSTCDPQAIATYCGLQTMVLVENASTDGGFLRLVVDKLRPGLRRHFVGAQPNLDVRQAGGIGELPKELMRLHGERASSRPSGSAPARIVVLCDSDGTQPGEISHNARLVQDAGRAAGVPVHVLDKRSIENYIPVQALQVVSEVRREKVAAVAALWKLAPAAYDHYPMKQGLTAAEKARTASLYASDIPIGAGLGDFMEDLLRNFYHTVTTKDLRQRDHANELEALLTLLEENL